MFHFSGYALLFFRQEQLRFTQLGFPIRKSPDQRLLTPPRSLSQLRRVLHRHLMPRHPPYALNFTFHYGTSDLLSQYSCAPYTNVSTNRIEILILYQVQEARRKSQFICLSDERRCNWTKSWFPKGKEILFYFFVTPPRCGYHHKLVVVSWIRNKISLIN